MEYIKQLILTDKKEEYFGSEESNLFKFELVKPDQYANRIIPWHWHPFPEFVYIIEGEIEIYSTDGMQTYHPEEMAFFNSNAMHRLQSAGNMPGCKFYAFLFPLSFIAGNIGSTISKKYFIPVMQSEIKVIKITDDGVVGHEMINEFKRISKINASKKFGYEFEIQHCLANMWQCFYTETKDLGLLKDKTKHSSLSEERLKEMLTYIHENYADKIEINELASKAGIGRRECFRCFKQVLSVTPIDYINEYRINRASEDLLHTSKSITEISADCGFDSGSYFTKTFHKYTGFSPKEYRQKALDT